LERVVRPGVFILAALIWGLLVLGETLVCSEPVDQADGTPAVSEKADE
jgi:hypothetical protein